jgi:4-hydroxybenzoate polyprenyltransferase
LTGLVRLVHPFPSILDGVVVGAVALLAGGRPADALRLALAMIALQFAIGALNDIVDAPADIGRLPPKPIPSGAVSMRQGRMVVAVAVLAGLGLAATTRVGVVGLAALVLAVGVAYDLRAKGTAWSWLPFAVGIPLLPVFGWYGAAGSLPAFFGALLPMAILAGAALAIANASADIELDLAAGRRSAATRLGPTAAWQLQAMLWVVVWAVATGWLARAGSGAPWTTAVGASAIALVAIVWLAHDGSPARRRRAWELEAVAVAVALVAWLGGVLSSA